MPSLSRILGLCFFVMGTGCTIEETGDGAGAGNGGSKTKQEPGTVEPGMVGIWQQTASANEQGFSATLKIRENGTYRFEHYSQGPWEDCAEASIFDQSTGAIDVGESSVTLRPEQRTIRVTGCGNDETTDLGSDPIQLSASASLTTTLIDETTLKLTLTGAPYTQLDLKLLQLDPGYLGQQPQQPAGFQLGTEGPYTELQGLWAPSAESDVGFYDPAGNTFYVPAYNGAEHKWIRFTPGGYELASVFENAAGADAGVCKKNIVYWERGSALFAVTETVNDHFYGDTRFVAEDARLVVEVNGCGEDDGVTTFPVPPLASYYKFEYQASIGFVIGCEYEKTAFQFAVCTNDVGWSTYRAH